MPRAQRLLVLGILSLVANAGFAFFFLTLGTILLGRAVSVLVIPVFRDVAVRWLCLTDHGVQVAAGSAAVVLVGVGIAIVPGGIHRHGSGAGIPE